jgi:hypothetical protein
MDLPPPSDANLAALLAGQRKKKTRMLLLVGGVGLTLALGIASASIVFGKEAKKKGDLAYSRTTKCLIGKPLAATEDPMLRFRAAWRGRLLDVSVAEEVKKTGGTRPAVLQRMDESEEVKARMWPNRCVTELVSLTDTLKEIGAMTEGKKDLGAASRALAKATAGDNWKNVDTFGPAFQDFLEGSKKSGFTFQDVEGVPAPTFVDALPVNELRDKKAIVDAISLPTGFASGELVAFVASSSRGPARICRGTEEGPMRCAPASSTGLPPEASGVARILGHDDGASPLLAFGRFVRVLDDSTPTTGVFRGGDGVRLVAPDRFYVAAGWSAADRQTVLLKDLKKPSGPQFKLTTAVGEKITTKDIELTNWNGEPSALAVAGARVYFATSDADLRVVADDTPKGGKPLFKLPGRVTSIHGCTVGTSRVLVLRTSAGGLSRVIVAFDEQSNPAVVDDGDVSCGAKAVHVVSNETIAVCTAAGCTPEPLPETPGEARARVGDDAFLVVESYEGLLVLRTSKAGKEIGKVVYDGRLEDGRIVPKSVIGSVHTIPTRNGALVAVDTQGATSFLGVNARGEVKRLAIE